MATVDKNFRIKNGLVVEGSTATVNGSNILTENSTEFIQDTAAGLITNGTHTNITVTYNDSTGTLNLVGAVTYTDEQAQDAVGNAVGTGLSYNDTTGAISVDTTVIQARVADVSDTEIGYLNGVTSAIQTQLNDKASSGDLSSHTNATEAHGATGAVVGTTNTQTLTNKTLTSPKINEDVALTATATELNVLDGITASTSELNLLDGVTATTTELNYVDGVTSSIQTQLDAKFATANASTTNISEGTNLYFTDERAQDAVGNSVGNGLDYDDASGAISVDPSEFTLNSVGVPNGSVSLNSQKITNLATPTDATDAVTKAYVDAATEGLHVHESARVATTANVNLANALENGDTLDGVTLATGDRVLVKNQTTQSENGIYVVQASGQPTRALDFDTAQEVDSGDFVFVYAGTANAGTGWVQTNRPATIGTDAILFSQFSGAGTYLAGNGLTLTGNSFSINTTVTADISTAQTLTNKSISGSANTLTNIPNNALSNSAITINGTSVSLGGTRTLGSDDISEGSTNKYFTDERAQDAIGNAVGTGLSYNDTTGAISVTANTYDAYGSADAAALAASNALDDVLDATTAFTAINVNSVAKQIAATTGNIASAVATTAYSWAKASYRSAEFLVKSKTATHTEITKIMLTLDSSDNVYLTEYGMSSTSGTSLQAITADINGSDVRIRVTPANNNTEVLITGTLLV